MSFLGIHDVRGEFEHVLRNLLVRDEIVLLVAHFVLITKRDKSLKTCAPRDLIDKAQVRHESL